MAFEPSLDVDALVESPNAPEPKAGLPSIEDVRKRATMDFDPVPVAAPLRRSRTPEQQKPPTNEWLTTNEAARYLKVKARTLLLWARQGKVKGYTLSGATRHVWRFRQVDLDATLEMPSVRPEERMVK